MEGQVLVYSQLFKIRVRSSIRGGQPSTAYLWQYNPINQWHTQQQIDI